MEKRERETAHKKNMKTLTLGEGLRDYYIGRIAKLVVHVAGIRLLVETRDSESTAREGSTLIIVGSATNRALPSRVIPAGVRSII